MIHLPTFIIDLAIILTAAAITSVVFKKLNQPVVLGYLMAGFLISPNFPLLPTIADIKSVQIWAEIGVIFFLFGLGLEFSLKKLISMGRTPIIIGLCEIPLMFLSGYLFGKFSGWSMMNSIFLGGIISISSTTIILKTFNDLDLKSKQFSQNVLGVLIIEDLMAVLLMVLLSTIAVTRSFEGHELIFSSLKLIFFLTMWIIVGIFIVPGFVRWLKNIINDEMILIVSLAMCLAMAFFATEAGFSAALGAFVMGSILSDTIEGKRIEYLLHPIKDLFGAVFFVSVGMLINPKIIVSNAPMVLSISFLVITMKILSNFMGSLLAGQTIKTAVRTGFSLAQIGEFSFIIATLGLKLKVINETIYPLAVSVSVITTFATPGLIKISSTVAERLENNLPQKVLQWLARYGRFLQTNSGQNKFKETFIRIIKRFVPLAIVVMALSMSGKKILLPFVKNYIDHKNMAHALAFMATFITSAPFLWAIINFDKSKYTKSNINFERILALYLQSTLLLILISIQVTSFFNGVISIVICLATTFAALFIFSNHLSTAYTWFESNFIQNWKNDNEQKKQLPKHKELAPWDGQLIYFTVPAQSIFVGHTIEQLQVREKYGVTIALLERGDHIIMAPGKDIMLFPNDIIGAIGSEEQLETFKHGINHLIINASQEEQNIESFGLFSLVLTEDSPYIGKKIRHSGIREKNKGLVVGIERDGKRILNPDSLTELKAQDLLWIVGKKLSK